MTADEQLRVAEHAYNTAAGTFSAAIVQWLQAKVRGAYPTATKVFARGEYNEDGAIRLRIQRVLNAHGALGDIDEPSETFEALADEVDPYLDWLADLDSNYFGHAEFEIGDTA